MIEIKKLSGKVLCSVDAETLQGAYLRGADLTGADLRGADLTGADLTGANLEGAYLEGAYLWNSNLWNSNLQGADLRGADLQGAYLQGAYLQGADLRDANLTGATMPDGRAFEAYRIDPLAGICDDHAAQERARSAWTCHTWHDCPMHAAYGWTGIKDAPAEKRRDVAAFVAVFDGGLL